MSRRPEGEVQGGYRYDSGPPPRHSIGKGGGMSIPIISETTVPSAPIPTTTTTHIGQKTVRDDSGGMTPQSRQFLSPDVGYGYHHHHLHGGGAVGGGLSGGSGGGGGTNLERVPSVNRLQPQSSTETSGLGETVTSGFSSQESVHSAVNYHLDVSTPTATTPTAEDGEAGRAGGGRRYNPHSPQGNPYHHPRNLSPSTSRSGSGSKGRHHPEGQSLSPQEARHLVGQPLSASSLKHAPRANPSSRRARDRVQGEDNADPRGYGASHHSGSGTPYTGGSGEVGGVGGGEDMDRRRGGAGSRERENERRRESGGGGGGRRGGNNGTEGGERERGGGGGATNEAVVGVTVAGRGSSRPRAVAGAGEIDRTAPPRARQRHGTATTTSSSTAVDRISRSSDSSTGNHRAAHSPGQHPASPPTDRDRAEYREPSRNGDKVSASRREKDKNSRSSPKEKTPAARDNKERGVYKTSSRDSVVRSPDPPLSRDGSRDGSNGKRRDSSSGKRDNQVCKDFSAYRQQEIYSLADNEVRDTDFVYAAKTSASSTSKDSKSSPGNGKEKTSIHADSKRKDKSLEKQKSRDSGIGRTLDRSHSREAVLEKQLSRDSGTGRSVEGQSPRESTRAEFTGRHVSVSADADPQEPRDRSVSESRNGGAHTLSKDSGTCRDISWDRSLSKHSSSDSTNPKSIRRVSRERTLERQRSVDDSLQEDLEAIRVNPSRLGSTDNPAGEHSSIEASRGNPHRSFSRERTLDRQTSVDNPKQSDNGDKGEKTDNSQRRFSRGRTLEKQDTIPESDKFSPGEKTHNPFRDTSKDRSQDRRPRTEEIQLRDLSREKRKFPSLPSQEEVDFSRHISSESSSHRDPNNPRRQDNGRRSSRDLTDRQPAETVRTADNDRHPQRRVSRERTLDRQWSVDETRQVVREENVHEPPKRTSRSIDQPVKQASSNGGKHDARHGERRSQDSAHAHGQRLFNAEVSQSVGRQRGREVTVRSSSREEDTYRGADRGGNRGDDLHRLRRDSQGRSTEDKNPQRRDSHGGGADARAERRSTDRRDSESRSIDRRQHQQRSEDSRDSESKSVDRRDSEDGSTDRRDSQSTDRRDSQSTVVDRRDFEERNRDRLDSQSRRTDRHDSLGRETDNRREDRSSRDRRDSQSRDVDRRDSHSKGVERRDSQGRSIDRQSTHERGQDRQVDFEVRSRDRRDSQSRSVDTRDSQGRSVDTRDSQSRSVDRRDSQGRSVDTRDSQSRSVDRRDSQSRSIDTRDSQSRSVDRRDSQGRSVDTRGSQNRSVDSRHSQNRSVDTRHSQNRSVDRRDSQSRSVDKRDSQGRSIDRHSTHEKSVDRPVGVDERGRDRRDNQSRGVDRRSAEDRSGDRHRGVERKDRERRDNPSRSLDRQSLEERSVDRRRGVEERSKDRRDGQARSIDRLETESRNTARNTEERGVNVRESQSSRAVDRRGADDRQVDRRLPDSRLSRVSEERGAGTSRTSHGVDTGPGRSRAQITERVEVHRSQDGSDETYRRRESGDRVRPTSLDKPDARNRPERSVRRSAEFAEDPDIQKESRRHSRGVPGDRHETRESSRHPEPRFADRQSRDLDGSRYPTTARPAHGGVQRVKAEERAGVHTSGRSKDRDWDRQDQEGIRTERGTDATAASNIGTDKEGTSRTPGQTEPSRRERSIERKDPRAPDKRHAASSITRHSLERDGLREGEIRPEGDRELHRQHREVYQARPQTDRERSTQQREDSKHQDDREKHRQHRENSRGREIDRNKHSAEEGRKRLESGQGDGAQITSERRRRQLPVIRDKKHDLSTQDRSQPSNPADRGGAVEKPGVDGGRRGEPPPPTATATARSEPGTMGSDGRHPPGQRQHPPRTIVTITSPTSPDNYGGNVFSRHTNGDVSHRGRQPSPRSLGMRGGREDFDDLFSQARKAKGPGPGGGSSIGGVPGLQVEQINHEWERRESRGSIRSNRSRSSHGGSFRSGRSGSIRRGKRLFLGVHTESAWTRWSRDRRASFRRRIELLDKPEENITRVSTPVRKARQEGLKFVHPDLEGTFLSEEDLNELRRHKQQKYHAIRVIEKNRKSKFRMKTEVHLTADQWQVISDFWEHPAFVRGRYLGLFLMLVSFVVMIVSITHRNWVSYGE